MRTLFRRAALVALCALAALVSGTAEARWLKLESSRFILYTEGSENEGRAILQDLHEYDALLAFFTNVKSPPPLAKLPIYLVDSSGELREANPGLRRLTAGVYRPTFLGTTALAMRGGGGLTARHILQHEYAHHFMLSNDPTAYPAWYVEGFAEYFGMTVFKTASMEVGNIAESRAYWLMNGRWEPIRNILVPPKGQARSEQFYQESWLFISYMVGDRVRRAQMQEFLLALSKGEETEAALRRTTGMDFAALDDALRLYIAKRRVTVFSMPRERLDVDVTVSTLSPAADELMLLHARLLGAVPVDQRKPTLAEVQRRAAKFPQDPFAIATLVMAAVYADDFAVADKALATLAEVAPSGVDAPYLHAWRYYDEGSHETDVARRNELWSRARPYTMQAVKANPNHYPSLYMYAVTTLARQEEASANTINALLNAQGLAPLVGIIRIEAAIALARVNRSKEAVAMLQPIANGPHDPESTAKFRALIARIEAGEPIAQPLGRFSEPMDDSAGQ